MRLLPKNQIRIERQGDCILAGLWEEEGYIYWGKFLFSDLPNDLISLDDLKRFGIDIVDVKPGRSE
jgi:hypothetical protein